MRSIDGVKAKDVMSSPVTVLQQGLPLDEAIQTLTDEGISGAPVVTAAGEPLGVISLSDVGMYLAGLERDLGELGDYYFRSHLRWDRASESWSNIAEDEDLLRRTVVNDVMTPEVVSVSPDTPLPEVVEELHNRHIHRVLVTREGRVVGVVTTMDVLGALIGAPVSTR